MRVLACALLVIATAHADLVCEPGDSRNFDGLVCFCTGDGLGWACAPPDRSVLSTENQLTKEKREATEETCQPGKIFKDYCNTCHCGSNGKIDNAVCTMMACDLNVWNKDGSLKNPEGNVKNHLLRNAREVQQNQDTCEPGKKFKYYCNSCFCGYDGLVAHSVCTRMYCNPNIWNQDGTLKETVKVVKRSLAGEVSDEVKSCEPGKPFKEYCNSCMCGDNGLIACTDMYCDPNVWNKDGTLKETVKLTKRSLAGEVSDEVKSCEPGKHFKDYCNSCICGKNGLVACTDMYCDPQVWNKDGSLKIDITKNPLKRQTREVEESQDTCEPGKKFKYYCNTCFCGDKGLVSQSACTRMYCNTDFWNKDGSLKVPAEIANNPLLRLAHEDEENQDTCEPGKQFKYYCNTCFCGPEGKVAESPCTRKACNPEFWNKDGSLKLPNEIAHNPLLREAREVEENQDTCEPGKQFKYYCNTCFCGPEGKVAQSACTRKACNPAFWNKDGSLKLPNEIANNPLLRLAREVEQNQDTCEPGKLFKYYCNSCYCGPEGKVAQSACTRMACNHEIWNKDGSLKLPNEILSNPLLRKVRETEGRCEAGKPFRHYCNQCVCSNDGRIDNSVCTQMLCDPAVWNKDGTLKEPKEIGSNTLLRKVRETEERCEAGKPFRNYCNQCVCSNDGRIDNSVCTQMLCDPAVWNKDGTLKEPKEIVSNPLLRKVRETEERCEAGKPFRNYCNQCVCSHDGRIDNSVCTQMLCDPAVWNKDGTLKEPKEIGSNPLLRKVRETEERCEAGKPFRRYCNQCVCSSDGRLDHSVCTQMFCDPEVWNKDGTLKDPKEVVPNPLLRKVRETEERCEAGKPFRRYCNQCVCSSDGKLDHSVCTQMFCDPEVWNKDGTLKDPKKVVPNPLLRKVRETEERCEAGKPFRRYCNQCVCSSDGRLDHSVCTQMFCDPEVWNKDGTLKDPKEVVPNPLLRKVRETEERCEAGKPFRRYCNQCVCSSDGRLDHSVCTQMFCDPEVWNKDGTLKDPKEVVPNPLLREVRDTEERCEAGKPFRRYCNQCVCSNDGRLDHSACTQMLCDPEVWNKDGTLKEPKKTVSNSLLRKERSTDFLCQPGKFFKDDCNTCTCGSDGKSRSCTMMLCGPKDDARVVAPQVCDPKKTFKIECNQCMCNDDGTKIACTKMACDRPAKLSVCVPNSTFKKDCNTCTCNSDGTGAACTLVACL